MNRLDQQKTAADLTRLVGTLNENLKIASNRTNTGGVTGLEFKTPKDGPGGYEDQPYDDFGDYRGPTIPNPSGGGDWAHTPFDSDSVIEKWGAVQDPSGEWMLPTKEGTLRKATDEEKLMIESDFQHRDENNLYDGHEHQEVAGNPFGFSDEYINRSKALREIIDGRGYDPATVTEAQKKWIQLQRMGDIWKRVDASDLTNTLKDKQNPRTGSINHLPDKERRDLLIRGVAAHKA